MMTAHLGPITACLIVTLVAIASTVGRLMVGLLARFLPSGILAALSNSVYGAGVVG